MIFHNLLQSMNYFKSMISNCLLISAQDWSTVVAIVMESLRVYKKGNNEVMKVYLKSDNAA